MPDTTPRWPIVIKVENDPQLLLWESASDIQKDDIPHHLDRTLVDSAGQQWQLDTSGALRAMQGITPLETFLDWLQTHAHGEGSCCVAKMYAPDYASAMEMARQLISD